MTTPLSAALARLGQSIGKLDNAIDQRVGRLEKQQTDLFSQLENERDHNKVVTRELDEIISELEQMLETPDAA